MNSRFFICFCILMMCMDVSNAALSVKTDDNYLSKPTGEYGIAFEDFRWINNNICPDPNFNGKNVNDFSLDNKNHCHEIISRIYYPTLSQTQPGDPYYSPLVKRVQDELRKVLVIPKKDIDQLSQIKSFTKEKLPVFSEKNYPVILFSPGLGCEAEMYENFITELVSHGYIVIGINSPFVSGDIALPNGNVVKYNSKYDDPNGKYDREIMRILSEDFSYVFDQIQVLHDSIPLFSKMELRHIGALGHSVGGNVVANATHQHTNWFQAAVTLDIGYDLSAEYYKKFIVPFMHTISSTIKARNPVPILEMGKDGFVIGISPTEGNRDYSKHMNFTDQSTLQFLPALQQLTWFAINILHQEPPLGNGNGWEITSSINTYLVQFFDTYLKNQKQSAFSDCKPLSKNTFIKCGPGSY